jgi:hypothetical protein
MPRSTLTQAQIEADDKRIEDLVAVIERAHEREGALAVEHLEAARTYLTGAMPEEYDLSLRSAGEVIRRFSDKSLRERAEDLIDALLGETRPPARDPRNRTT